MSVRAALAAAAALMVAACTPSGGDRPQLDVSSMATTGPVVTSVPADRWRAVLVAGDNNSPAFDNGVESLREKLAALGVKNISVLSADAGPHPGRPAGEARASSGNVRGALRGLGGGDACLAFVTSHGNEEGFFLRADRRFVEPPQLEQALDAGCGSLPTVVVISACHSGTFMTNALRRPNRIVLVAAARDRTSFGCGVADLYTYYDQCFLDQFDQAKTWRELAASTRNCVEGLERSLGIKVRSDPQQFFGAWVTGLRLPGR
jgi:hypothetical protein